MDSDRQEQEDDAYDNAIEERLVLKGVHRQRFVRAAKREAVAASVVVDNSVHAPRQVHFGVGGREGVSHTQVPSEEVTRLKMTAAERQLETIRAEREVALLQAQASKSHREKVDNFNAKLAAESEHHDVPKISYAGMG